MLVSCDFEDSPWLQVSESYKEIGAAGGDFTFQVYSNYEWAATPSTAALTVTPLSGEGNAVTTVTVTVPENIEEKAVEYAININTSSTSGGQFISYVLRIYQSGQASAN